MAEQLVQVCCRIYLGNPDIHEAGVEATCFSCSLEWVTRACDHDGQEWFCAEPGLGTRTEIDEEGNEVEHTVTLAWGGNATVGSAFEGKDDDTAIQTGLEPGGSRRGMEGPPDEPARSRS